MLDQHTVTLRLDQESGDRFDRRSDDLAPHRCHRLIEPGYSETRDAISVLGARDAARPADCRWTIDATCRAREMAGELSESWP